MKRFAFVGSLVICMGVLASPCGAQVGFSQQDFATGAGPAAVVVGDFNGDGKLDLATANATGNSVSILLGNGDGTFQAKLDFPTGMNPRGIVAGLFNGDAHLDLATANDTDNSVSILLGNGDGTFQAKMDFPAGTGTFALVAGHFNADTNLDIATANRVANTVSILPGNGDGTLGPRIDFLANTEPLTIVAGDFNGDSKLDVATGDGLGNVASVLLGNGDGTLGTKTDFPTGTRPRSLVAIDFSLDGKLDLATANQSSNNASVLLGNGDGTFAAKMDLGTDTEPIAVSGVDLDGDGKPDLTTANRGVYFYYYYSSNYYYPSLSVRLGNGDGTFGSLLQFPFGYGFRLVPESAASGDFNGDGKVDLALAKVNNNTVTVLLQAPAISLSIGHLSFGSFLPVGIPTAPMDVVIDSTGSFPAVFGSATVTGPDAADFNITGDTCSNQTVAIGSNCTTSVTFTPSTVGNKSATLNLPSDAAGNPHLVTLSGSGAPNMPVASVTPSMVAFGSVFIGSTSGTFAVDLQNTGSVQMNISGIVISGTNAGDFSILGTGTCPAGGGTLGPGVICSIHLRFTPAAGGSRTATLSITTDAAGSPHMVALSGTGVAPAVSLSQAMLTFAAQNLGSTSAGQPVVLTNTGNGALTILGIVISGVHAADFVQSHNCPLSPNTLAVSATCTITVTFTPTVVGTRNAAVTISDNAPGSPHLVTLTGTGVAPTVSLSQTTLTFATQNAGSVSPGQNVVLTNTGSGALTILSISITGTNTGDFAQTHGCPLSPSTLAPSNSCTITVTFAPVASGMRTAAVTISDNAPGSPHLVTLTGTGAAPTVSLSQTTLTFATQNAGSTSPGQDVTLTNTGSGPLTILSISVTGANAGDFARTHGCPLSPNTLPALASCTITVTFTPLAGGTRSAAVTITHNAAGSPQAVTLSGTGADFTITAPSSSSTAITIAAGQTASFMLTLTPNGFTGTITLTCTGAPAAATCSVPASVMLSGTPVTITIMVTTTARGTAPPRSTPWLPGPGGDPLLVFYWWLALAILALLAILQAKRPARLRARLALAGFLLMVIIAPGCGGGASGPPPMQGTPAGNYPLTVTASSGGFSRNIALNLTVQ